MVPTNILITGASGFIGQRFLTYNVKKYVLITVSLQAVHPANIDFSDIYTIVHFAGIAHQMKRIEDKVYFDINFELTKEFADAAKRAGVAHFVFISTTKVFGEHQNQVLSETSPCNPQNDPYAESKLQAEQYLQSIEDANFTVSIVRPPLVYGPGVKGNLIRFLHLADKNWPLPFANIANRRTMVYLDNLVELINRIVDTRKSGVFLAGDTHPISTTLLLTEMRLKMSKSPRLFVLPGPMRQMLQKWRPEMVLRLWGSQEMDTRSTNERLGFTPPYSIQHGIADMVEWYIKERQTQYRLNK